VVGYGGGESEGWSGFQEKDPRLQSKTKKIKVKNKNKMIIINNKNNKQNK
jgi:hypothetical protein